MLVTHLAPERTVLLSGTPDQRTVLHQLAALTSANWSPALQTAYLQAILVRETLTTTGVGRGLAVPHARLDHLERSRLTIAVIPGGIDWAALDDAPVRVVAMLATRETERSEHLQLLAAAVAHFGNVAVQASLCAAMSDAEVWAALQPA
jgi:mannitol/fructose-specific phosphotransferase system IIA component (Ntr-type)